jgi:MFS family permease
MFRALRIPAFRRYFVGQLSSMCGSWAQTVAMAWLVLRLTGSGTTVGVLTAVQFAPVVLLSAWAGAIADSFDQRRSVLVVQTVLGVQAAVLATVVLTDVVALWMLYPLAVVQGIGLAFDTPSRQSLVGRIVGNDDLRNALSLNAGLVQVARVVGPAMAGILIETSGIGICFAINAASYVVIIAAVIGIRMPSPRPARSGGRARRQVREGVRVVVTTPELRDVLLLALVVGLASVSFTVALPLLVRERFGDDAGTFGLLAAVYGLGALAGAVASAARPNPTKGLLVRSMVTLGLALALCAERSHLAVVMPGVAAAGFVGLLLGVTLNASLQLGAPTAMRGRVIGLYFLVAFGSNVAGGPLVGWIAETWTAGASFGVSAVAVLAVGLALAWHWRRRLAEPPAHPSTVG